MISANRSRVYNPPIIITPEAKAKSIEYARNGRRNPTEKEEVIRRILLKSGLPFLQQKVVHFNDRFYIIDFYIKKPYKVCLEIDGWQHLGNRIDYDVNRTSRLERDKRLKVIRFRNDEVKETPEFESMLILIIKSHYKHWIGKF
mgnify:CR=1 FL=1